jgi:hypothetical protein
MIFAGQVSEQNCPLVLNWPLSAVRLNSVSDSGFFHVTKLSSGSTQVPGCL